MIVEALNKAFAENQREREDCVITNCPAPKFTTVPTEEGLPIAVYLYHEIEFWPEEKRDDHAQELVNEDWETVKQAYQEVAERNAGDSNE